MHEIERGKVGESAGNEKINEKTGNHENAGNENNIEKAGNENNIEKAGNHEKAGNGKNNEKAGNGKTNNIDDEKEKMRVSKREISRYLTRLIRGKKGEAFALNEMGKILYEINNYK
jgi:hypothetical protein